MYTAKDYSHLLGASGFSDMLLNNHFKLYQGYVNATNVAANRLTELEAAGETGPGEYAEIKRRFGWEFNGMRLHEYYFGNMKKDGTSLPEGASLHAQIIKDFASYEAWESDFRSTGSIRGIGWTVLFYDKHASRLLNVWINEHDMGPLAGSEPILVMDVFEHAFMTDYGLSRPDYIASFMKAIDWNVAQERFKG